MHNFINKTFLLLFSFCVISFNLNADPIKKIIQLKTINDIFPEIENIKITHKDIIDVDAFESHNTAFVFDIDGTITVEDKHIFNQELVREQQDDTRLICERLNLTFDTFMRHIDCFRLCVRHGIKLVEENTASFINDIQTKGYLAFTCTASHFAPNDLRLRLMKNNNIDFSKSFADVFDDVDFDFGFDFFSSLREHRGHTSARDSSKAEKIDTLIQQINDIREIRNLPLIENLVFVDNYYGEVNDICQNCKIKNIISFYYTYVKHNTSTDEIINDYNRYIVDCKRHIESYEKYYAESVQCDDSEESEEDDEEFEENVDDVIISDSDNKGSLVRVDPQNTIDAFIIPVIYDLYTKDEYCLVKIGMKDAKNILLIDSYPVSKNTLCEKELSTYLETELLGKFDFQETMKWDYRYFSDTNINAHIYFLNKLKADLNKFDDESYIKVSLFDFISSIECGSPVKINDIYYNICPSFSEKAFGLIDEINEFKYLR